MCDVSTILSGEAGFQSVNNLYDNIIKCFNEDCGLFVDTDDPLTTNKLQSDYGEISIVSRRDHDVKETYIDIFLDFCNDATKYRQQALVISIATNEIEPSVLYADKNKWKGAFAYLKMDDTRIDMDCVTTICFFSNVVGQIIGHALKVPKKENETTSNYNT